jgi:hypothetical protein
MPTKQNVVDKQGLVPDEMQRKKLAMPYSDYLKSDKWKRKRKAALKRAGYRCRDCGAAAHLDVHHLTYAHIGREWKTDLIVLCRSCHEKRHRIKREDDMIDLNTRQPSGRLGYLMDKAMEDAAAKAEAERLETRTPRIGASMIGEGCMRRLQYAYFKAPPDRKPSGKALRIFRRGHEGEDWMAEWLRLAGFNLYTVDENGAQKCFRALDGKLLGYADGVFLGGPEEFGPYPRLWENKVLGSKGWNKVDKEGVQKAYPVYYGQVQLYMAYFDLADDPALFTALNADTMEVYAENIPFDAAEAQRLSDRAVNVVSASDAGQLLPRCTTDEDFFECKFCDWHERCWRDS